MPEKTWLARLVAFGATAAASIAHADCPPPTESQCFEDPLAPDSYFATECGLAEWYVMGVDPGSVCYQAISARSEGLRADMVDGLAAVPTDLRPPGPMVDYDRDYIASASIGVYDESADPVTTTGLASHYAGVGQRFRSAQLGGALDGIDPQALRQAWNANDTNVESCEEYVYERYYDYSVYEDNTAYLGTDYRAMFTDGQARLANGIHSKAGNLVTYMPPPAERSAKNVFFTYRHDYPADTPDAEKHQFQDPDLVARLDRGKDVYRHTMTWHAYMDATLTAEHGDPLLSALAQKQRDFIKLLEERAAVLRRWSRYDAAMRTSNNSCDGKFRSPNFGFLRPWEEIWNPADKVSGWRLTRVYERDAFDDIALATPLQLSMLAPGYDEGVFQSPAVGYGIQAIDVQNLLAAAPDDLLANMQYTRLASSDEADMAELDEVVPEPVPDICLNYTGADELPLVGDDLSCQALFFLLQCSSNARSQVAAKLREIDARIEQALNDVAPYHCLDLENEGMSLGEISLDTGTANGIAPSPCDWNPELFVREAANHFGAEREREFQTCVEATGGTFYATHPIHNATNDFGVDGEEIATPDRAGRFGVPVLADYTGTTELVAAFIGMAREWASAVDFQRDPRTGKPIAGHSASDSDSLGNSTFGVDYGYSAEWKLDGLPTDSWSSEAACRVNLYAQAGAYANGTVFGKGIPLLDAFAHLDSTPVLDEEGRPTNRRSSRSELRLEILGVDILNRDGITKDTNGETSTGAAPIKFHVAKEVGDSKELASMTFVVAGVPVTVRAGVAGRVAVEFDAMVDLISACPSVQTSMTGKLVPSASLDAFVSGGVNLALVEVGLQIDLTLIKVALPFVLDLHLLPLDDTPMIVAAPRLSIVLTTLSGQLRAYLRFPIGKPAYITLFSWPGVELAEVELFAPKWRYPLPRVAMGLRGNQ